MGFLGKLKEVAQKAVATVRGALSQAYEATKAMVGGAVKSVGNVVTQVAQTAATAGKKWAGKLAKAVQKGKAKVRSKLKKAKDAAKKFAGKMPHGVCVICEAIKAWKAKKAAEQAARDRAAAGKAAPKPVSEPPEPVAPTVPGGSPSVLRPPCSDYNPDQAAAGQRFGASRGTGKKHNGVDLLVHRLDSPSVVSMAPGVVRYIGPFGAGWGKAVFVEHDLPSGPVIAVYGHIAPDSKLKEGAEVKQGDTIGVVDPKMYGPKDKDGKNTSVPHLHLGTFSGSYKTFPKKGWGTMSADTFPGGWTDPTTLIKTETGK